jgi:hypothetical protein
MTPEKRFDAYFGTCPVCHKSDGFLNVGRSHWHYCKEHKTTWCSGSNLFSSWRNETEDEQRKLYDEVGMAEFENVTPYHAPGDWPQSNEELARAVHRLTDSSIPF